MRRSLRSSLCRGREVHYAHGYSTAQQHSAAQRSSTAQHRIARHSVSSAARRGAAVHTQQARKRSTPASACLAAVVALREVSCVVLQSRQCGVLVTVTQHHLRAAAGGRTRCQVGEDGEGDDGGRHGQHISS